MKGPHVPLSDPNPSLHSRGSPPYEFIVYHFYIYFYTFTPFYVSYIMLSCFSPVWLFVTPWTVAGQAPLSLGFSRQECWSGLPCPPPGDLPHPGIEPASFKAPALQEDSFTTKPPGKPLRHCQSNPSRLPGNLHTTKSSYCHSPVRLLPPHSNSLS